MIKDTDKLLDNLGESITWIAMGVLFSKINLFENNKEEFEKFFHYVQDEENKWGCVENPDAAMLIHIAKNERRHIYDACIKVPFSQLLYLTSIKDKKSSKNPKLKKYLQTRYCMTGVWLDVVLEEKYQIPLQERIELFHHINNWIDSYQKGYLNNEMLNEMFKEDIQYDMAKGVDLSHQEV